ncbi:MAG TPA: MGMT family protein [Candidatus Bathyarchaeia archaeon]|nr:MGMT family protein [Candidatus Bathyarchaeia archaeon]
MDEFKISTDRSGEMNFGILLDQHGLIVASALGRNARSVGSFLQNYSRRIIGRPPVEDEKATMADMIALFEGKKPSKLCKLNVSYTTSFQSRVHKVMSKIPRGRVTTYGLIAKKLETGSRAVGNAVASNPWPIFIPCHRVIPSNLSVGNYSICGTLGVQGSSTKLELLQREGVPIDVNTVAAKAVWIP